MKYLPNEIEAKWQKYWKENQTFRAENESKLPKYYVLDMFPYPSGAGLHVGHPLGYIASDIYARFKRHQGFNVLHPMGYDSFGLPAEQYAIQTGQHPAVTTETNINRYREQLDKIGFSFDWSREVRTSNPDYYKWTQWIFLQLFNSWYNLQSDRAEPIDTLIDLFETFGNTSVKSFCDEDIVDFSSEDWSNFSEEQKQIILLKYRLTYLAESEVNWCPALGTVLANDEIVNGVSERGGHPVVRKKMTQWSMRIAAYADRLLQGLERIDWPEPLKEIQRNWFGKSVGATVEFRVLPHPLPLSKGEGSNLSAEAPSKGEGGNLSTEVPSKGEGSNLSAEVSFCENVSNPNSDKVEKDSFNDFGYKTANPAMSKFLIDKARENRKTATEAENLLWQAVRNHQLGYKIRRQHYIDRFIVDFVCLSKKLVFEVDGEIHLDQEEYDASRTYELEQFGFKVIRFKNEDVLNNIDSILSKIKSELEQRPDYTEPQVPFSTRESTVASSLTPLSFGEGLGVRIFTTRPDTIFGVSFMVLAPEHDLVAKITTPEHKVAVRTYVEASARRSERERMADVKTVSGVFTGAYAEHPFTKNPIPIWIGDYVLAGYGTGAVMAVPCGDQRDYDFAKHFGIEIPNIFEGVNISEQAYSSKDQVVIANSDFLNGLGYKEATTKVIEALEKTGLGKAKINYRLRDAVFSRQRYWGEPIPMYYKNGVPRPLPEHTLPLTLPEVEKYLPTEAGDPPLGNAQNWAWDTQNEQVVSNTLIDNQVVFPLELNTMPGWAGSSWYFNRYMDASNKEVFASQEALNYWQDVDLYIGGSEHATGHLVYSRFWQKFLFDRGWVPVDEFAKKLINQGMILGMSAFILESFHETVKIDPIYISNDLLDLDNVRSDWFDIKDNFYQNKGIDRNIISEIKFRYIHIDISLLKNENEVDLEKLRDYREDFKHAFFICNKRNEFKVLREVEKMSKSKYNVVNPDEICEQYGADTLRMYEMFLGPLEQAKPWNTAGITGVFGFLKKMWRLYFDETGLIVTDNEPSGESLKTLHKTIKKVTEDIDNFSFNTSVSSFMIAVNELSAQNCHERAILEPLVVLISPYAPHIAEELWEKLGHQDSVSKVAYPKFEEKYLIESEKEYPVSFNGKMRFTITLSLDLSKEAIERAVLSDERTQKQLEGRQPKKIIIVPGKIVNIVE